ncbi:hypothetical protein ACQP1G_20105 [Nocardia sp. CA-107356]|uniref:hypothetical protein n=1 Tax=Nocardia sp. CA-107356 TaxID=3239972 RepID=UPI003D9226F6
MYAAAGNTATFFLLFQPWLTASGPDGKARANAFGRIDATTSYLTLWSQSPPPTARITGTWAIFASAAIIITLCAVVVNIRLRTEALSRLTTISTVTTAVFVLLALVYIDSKGPELKATLGRSRDLGGHIGSIMGWAIGNSSPPIPGLRQTAYSSATLTPWAIVASMTSLGSAVAAVTQWIRRPTTDPIYLPWRISISRTACRGKPEAD